MAGILFFLFLLVSGRRSFSLKGGYRVTLPLSVFLFYFRGMRVQTNKPIYLKPACQFIFCFEMKRSDVKHSS